MAVPVFRGADRILGAVQNLAAHNAQERAIAEAEKRERARKRANRFGMTAGVLGAVGAAALTGGNPMAMSAGYGLGNMVGQTAAGEPPGPEQTIPTVMNAAGAVQSYQQQQRQQAAQQQMIGAVAPAPTGAPPMIAAPPAQPTVATDEFGVPQMDQPLVQPQASPQMTPEQYEAAVKKNQLMTGLVKGGYGAEVAGAIVKQMFPSSSGSQAAPTQTVTVQGDDGPELRQYNPATQRYDIPVGPAVTKSDAQRPVTVKPGDTLVSPQGEVIYQADGKAKDGKTITVSPGQTVIDESGEVIYQAEAKPEEGYDFGKGDPRNIVTELGSAGAKRALTEDEVRKLNIALGEAARPTQRMDQATGQPYWQMGQNLYDELPPSLQKDPRVRRPTVETPGAVSAGGGPTTGAVERQPTYGAVVGGKPRPTAGQQKDLAINEILLTDMKGIAKVYKPELVGPIAGRKLYAKRYAPEGLAELSKDEANYLAFESGVHNRVILMITGAQMTEAEAARIKGELFKATDQPAAWEANYQRTYRNMRMMNERMREMGNLDAIDESEFPPEPPSFGNVRKPDQPPGAQAKASGTAASPAVVTPPKPPEQWDAAYVQEIPLPQVRKAMNDRQLMLSLPDDVFYAIEQRIRRASGG